MVDLTLVALVSVALLAILVARGLYIIGRGSEAEMNARAMSADSTVATSGWGVLDSLRQRPMPRVAALEAWLGINQDDDQEGENS